MHAMIVKVRIDRYDEAMKSLREDLVPTTKGAPGFVKGTWAGNEEAGCGFVVFETEAQAQAMAAMVAAGPDDPVQVESVEVLEVQAEA